MPICGLTSPPSTGPSAALIFRLCSWIAVFCFKDCDTVDTIVSPDHPTSGSNRRSVPQQFNVVKLVFCIVISRQNRRTIINQRGAIVASWAVITGTAVADDTSVRAVSGNGSDRVQIAFRTVDSLPSREPEGSLQQKTFQAYREGGDQSARAGRATQTGDDTPLVGFAVACDNAVVPQHLTVKTTDSRQVEKQQRQLKERASSVRKKIQPTSTTSQQVLPQDDSIWQQELLILSGGGGNNNADSIDYAVGVYGLRHDGVNEGKNFTIGQTMTRKPEDDTHLNRRTIKDWQKAVNSLGVEPDVLIGYALQENVTGDRAKANNYSAHDIEEPLLWGHFVGLHSDVSKKNWTASQDTDEHIAELHQTQTSHDSSIKRDREMNRVSAVEVNQPSEPLYDIAKVDAIGTFFDATGRVLNSANVTYSQLINIDFSLYS